jgi:threonylcarbamoyladenosine tRNA methylthiotransferase MtaB
MPHLHLSLQAGSDLILKRMRRRHGRGDAIRLAERLKAARPGIAIGADLIAGFPTENEAMFRDTLALLDACDVVHAHVFPYSAKAGTPAARMPQVPMPVRRERAARLREAAAGRKAIWLRSLVGSEQAVLVERPGTQGHAGNFAEVRLAAPAPVGSVVRVVVEGTDGATLLPRHSRAGGNPETMPPAGQTAPSLDSRLRGNDGEGVSGNDEEVVEA